MTRYMSQLDSPSKQLMLDLARELEDLRIHNTELKKVKAYERNSFYEKLDRIDDERETQHNAALDRVAVTHGKVREEAEETLRDHIRAEEEERRRKEEEARKERERIEREKAEKLLREQEEAAKEEAERKAQEEAKKKAAEEAERVRNEQERNEREQQEEEKRKQEAATRKAEQDAAQRKKETEEAERQDKMGGGRQTDEETKTQLRYIEIHQHLKKFRNWLKEQGQMYPVVKRTMGDMRRSIRKSVGQLREGKGANKGQLSEIRTTLENASKITEPSVDISDFLANPPTTITQPQTTPPTISALLLYGLNIFAKALLSSLITEASINPAHAEPIGIMAAQIFSLDTFMHQGTPLVDILWAKYRVLCPALWGFYGDERTDVGRKAVGWWKEGPEGPYVSEQTHTDRMTALGAGFAALTLRNFGRTPRKNPFPNHIFWYCMHKIVNVPPAEIQETHVILLTAMLRSSAERVAGFFGHVGVALLRKAIVDIPEGIPRQTMSVNQLKLLKDLYRRERNIIL